MALLLPDDKQVAWAALLLVMEMCKANEQPGKIPEEEESPRNSTPGSHGPRGMGLTWTLDLKGTVGPYRQQLSLPHTYIEPWSWVSETPSHSGNILLSRACSTGWPGCPCTPLEPLMAFLPPYSPSPLRHRPRVAWAPPTIHLPTLLKVGTSSSHHNRTCGPGIPGPWGEGGHHQAF